MGYYMEVVKIRSLCACEHARLNWSNGRIVLRFLRLKAGKGGGDAASTANKTAVCF